MSSVWLGLVALLLKNHKALFWYFVRFSSGAGCNWCLSDLKWAGFFSKARAADSGNRWRGARMAQHSGRSWGHLPAALSALQVLHAIRRPAHSKQGARRALVLTTKGETEREMTKARGVVCVWC